MGTNFFLLQKNNNQIHIGKRMRGWKFLWDFQDIKNSRDFLNFLRTGRIFDEYDREWDLEAFLYMAQQWEYRDGIVDEEISYIVDNKWVVSKYIDFC